MTRATTSEITSKNASDIIMTSLRSCCEVTSQNNDLTFKLRLFTGVENNIGNIRAVAVLRNSIFFPFQILAAFLIVKVKKCPLSCPAPPLPPLPRDV